MKQKTERNHDIFVFPSQAEPEVLNQSTPRFSIADLRSSAHGTLSICVSRRYHQIFQSGYVIKHKNFGGSLSIGASVEWDAPVASDVVGLSFGGFFGASMDGGIGSLGLNGEFLRGHSISGRHLNSDGAYYAGASTSLGVTTSRSRGTDSGFELSFFEPTTLTNWDFSADA